LLLYSGKKKAVCLPPIEGRKNWFVPPRARGRNKKETYGYRKREKKRRKRRGHSHVSTPGKKKGGQI